jgi:hypothetical protein
VIWSLLRLVHVFAISLTSSDRSRTVGVPGDERFAQPVGSIAAVKGRVTG